MPETVLVLDDNPANREMMRSIFVIEGCEVVDYAQPEEALEGLDMLKPSIFIVDYHMPTMDGVSFAKKAIEMDAAHADKVFVLVTGDVEVADAADLTFLSRAEIIVKPATLNEIRKAAFSL